jgi:hypothetical protein
MYAHAARTCHTHTHTHKHTHTHTQLRSHTIPVQIDLSPFVEDPALEKANAKFTLQSVLAFEGEAGNGRYVAFIRPRLGEGDGEWYKFDSAVVTVCTADEAIMGNFGNESTRACMLV